MMSTPFKVGCALLFGLAPIGSIQGFSKSVADTSEQIALLEHLTAQLRENRPTTEQINQWSTLALSLNEIALWQSLKEHVTWPADSQSHMSNEAWLLFNFELDTNKIGGLAPLAASMGQDTLKWQLAKYAQIQGQRITQYKRTRHLIAPEFEELSPHPTTSSQLPIILLALSFLMMMGISLVKILRSKREKSSSQINTNHPIINDIQDRLRQEQSNQYSLAISQLELKIHEKTLENSLKEQQTWVELSNRQKLLLYLLLQGHSAEDCAEFLQISKGHIYNQRSELRRLFKLNNDDPFSSILK
jgi:DNA-binding CsgD family transcriptional regulator